MAMFGSSWLNEPTDNDRPIVGSEWLDDTHYDYFVNERGEYQKIKTKSELKEAESSDNVYEFDGKNYYHKLSNQI
jgi:hypothetical protein